MDSPEHNQVSFLGFTPSIVGPGGCTFGQHRAYNHVPACDLIPSDTHPPPRPLATKGFDPSDAELMRRVQQGETGCFAELVRRYRNALLRAAQSRLGRDDWAEEAVQEALLAAFKARHTYNQRFGFRTWLWTILLNRCRRTYARERRSPRVLPWSDAAAADADDVPLENAASKKGTDASPASGLMRKERSAFVDVLLSKLSDVQADALRLRYFGGLKFQEIADAMECSLGTAKNRVKWGLLRMSTLLAEDDQLRDQIAD